MLVNVILSQQTKGLAKVGNLGPQLREDPARQDPVTLKPVEIWPCGVIGSPHQVHPGDQGEQLVTVAFDPSRNLRGRPGVSKEIVDSMR